MVYIYFIHCISVCIPCVNNNLTLGYDEAGIHFVRTGPGQYNEASLSRSGSV